MNFLQLCQFAHRYIGGGNAPPGTAPLDVNNQQGEMFSLVQSVKDAYLDVLNAQTDWIFMQAKGTFALMPQQTVVTKDHLTKALGDYNTLVTLIGDGARYILVEHGLGTAKSSPTPCIFVPYQQWRGWKDRPPIGTGKPAYFTVQPDESWVFDVKASVPYTLTFDYRKRAPELNQNGSVPIFNEEHHAIIAWRAVLLWGGTNESAAKVAFAKSEYERILNDMRLRYLPDMQFSVSEFSGSRNGLTQ